MSKIKNSTLDQYDIEPFEQQQFGPAGVENVNEYLGVKFSRFGLKVPSLPNFDREITLL